MIELPYGRVPYPRDHDRAGSAAEAVLVPAPRTSAISEATVDAPCACPWLARVVRPAVRVTVIVRDATRHEPVRWFLESVARSFPTRRSTRHRRNRRARRRRSLAIATATPSAATIANLPPRELIRLADLPFMRERHRAPDLLAFAIDSSRIPAPVLPDLPMHDHDRHRATDLLAFAIDSSRTPAPVPPCVNAADLRTAAGCIQLAGFGSRAKAGVSGPGQARATHAMRTYRDLAAVARSPAAIDGRPPGRGDFQAAALAAQNSTLVRQGVATAPGRAAPGIVGRTLPPAGLAGPGRARGWFHVCSPRAPGFIPSDVISVTTSPYQIATRSAVVEPTVLGADTLGRRRRAARPHRPSTPHAAQPGFEALP